MKQQVKLEKYIAPLRPIYTILVNVRNILEDNKIKIC